MSVYLEAHDGESRTANYSTFYIDDKSTNYFLHVSHAVANLLKVALQASHCNVER